MNRRGILTVAVAAMVLLCGPARMPGWAGPPQDVPAAITTDSIEYCGELAVRAQTIPNQTDAIRLLVQTGWNLCQHGKTGAGISRLRRAMRAMHDRPAP